MSNLNVAVIHYHFRRGGVTRVIENALRALAGTDVRVAVLVGEPPPQPAGAIHTVEGLGYADADHRVSGRQLATSLRQVASKALGGPPDLWHAHNHALGKNPALPVALHHLACDRERLLLQIHDFAEDGRPAEYLRLKKRLGGGGGMGTRVYPQAPQVHYALLNRRDFGFVAAAGVDRSRRHLLANAIAGESPLSGSRHEPAPADSDRLFLYPTRAIRRKNVGELLFWAAVAERGERFATTLAPENPVHLPGYERWRAFARELALPVEFGLGATTSLSFAELVSSAYRLVTTSVAEGFGMAFLEPWLFGRAALGRDLPEITADFAEDGIDLSALYPRLGVPAGWIHQTGLRNRVADRLAATWRSYGREPGEESIDRAIRSTMKDGRIDFGRLDEDLQEEVVRRLIASRSARTEIRPERLECAPASPSVIRNNEEAVRARYGLEAYGERLLDIYRAVMRSPRATPGPLNAEVLLDQFLAPERFCLLRS